MTSEQLFYDKKTGFDRLTKSDKTAMQAYAEGYKAFLDAGKTERDAVKEMVKRAESKGFRAWTRDDTLKAGDKIYQVNRNKGITLAVIGKKSLREGVRLTAAHLDAPRIDIRTVPLYEDGGMAYFKTHYYGGIKKYQWTAIPLELRGVVCVCHNGQVKKVEVSVGAKPDDPKFVITDLLPHLATEQMSKKATEVVKGEGLNVLIGSVPSDTGDDKCTEKVKLAIMEHLNREYGMVEADFLSAELCCVPAWNACDIGFDRSFVGAYGHDDRVCSYTAATAMLDLKGTPAHTCVCLLVDKEETGSDGVTGMQSRAFDTLMDDLCRAQDVLPGECLENSVCLSADVCNAFDPNFPEVSEKRNDAKINCGFALVKYTGARGKSGTSDATAELMARIRCIFDKANVIWQTGQLGKVDQGGGGTVAMYLANRNIDTVDAGVPVLSMHAPFEVIAKLDLYMAYKGFSAFYKD
ncbi:aminopeptidase [Agathobaculum sp.]|uniref:aminopeptidase n=1 Tax=Agathobaculum sp. TaxID=2048138 RepID=UPI002A8114CB|nr:aminopeptidase [Agathobaculum sp.]MDY3618413.1 aminopeptidase [Agathobaculum sp.]